MQAKRIGVVRDAYRPYNEPQRPLSSAVAALGQGMAAVNSDLALWEQRLLVDEYVRNEQTGQYQLHKIATDMFRYISIYIYTSCRGVFATR